MNSPGKNSKQGMSRTVSVEQLIQLLKAKKPWTLCIAQRPFEWSPLRVINLVDSLLRGFPIGTIIVFDTKDPFYILDTKTDLRVLQSDEDEHTQIIDGQQRCASILASYCGDGMEDQKTGRKIFLCVNVREFNHRFKDFDTKQGQRYYFHWSSRKYLNNLSGEERKVEKLPPGSPSTGWILFSELYRKVIDEISDEIIADRAELKSDEQNKFEVIHELRDSLIEVANIPRIPIHQLSPNHDTVEDLHQVFIRINTGGMPLSAVDEFFAGVKKYWPDAEEHIKCLVEEDSPFGRRDAITVLARCAAMSLENRFDPYRLNLQHLARSQSENANLLIEKMKQLTPPDGKSMLVEAVNWVGKVEKNWFYSGMNEIPSFATMSAVAWAFRYAQNNSGKLSLITKSRWTDPVIRFLFWTTVFGSRRYGRGRFDRETFRLAWESGTESEVFPYDDEQFQELCYNYERIKPRIPIDPRPERLKSFEGNDKNIIEHCSWNMKLFLGIYQRIEHFPIDWDHILANGYARRHFKKGKLIMFEHYHWIHYVGNFAGIDAHANKVLQDKPPSKKLGEGKTLSKTYCDTEFIKTDPMLEDKDIERLLKVERYFNQKNQQEAAGGVFREFVLDRTLRIWIDVIDRVGDPPKPLELAE